MITTLCYIEEDDKYLMLYRNKKKDDLNEGKWIGIGGKIEDNETPLECVVREIKEETGLNAIDPVLQGLVSFSYNDNESEYMYLYTCKDFTGNVLDNCNEGELKWINKSDILSLSLWEGDRIFLPLLDKKSDIFYLTLRYLDDNLIDYQLEYD